MKRVLITGGAGFIGTNLVKKLLSQHNQVIAADNLITGNIRNVGNFKKNNNFIFLNTDVLVLKNFPFRIDEIYHLACPTGVTNLFKLGEEMLLSCSLGTRNILEIAKKNKSKFLLASSSEVYGNPKVFPQKETYSGDVNQLGFRSTYEEGKRFSESLTTFYGKRYNIDTKIVRIFNTYGPHMSFSDTRVIPKFLTKLTKGKPLTVEGNGKQSRTFCYVNDLVEGLVTVMEKGERNEVYNLGSEEKTSIKELARSLIKISKRGSLRYVKRPYYDVESRLPDLSKVKKLGWKPSFSLEEGLRETLKWYGL